jgi:hypothetical protein
MSPGLPPHYIPPEHGDNILHSALLKFALRQTGTFRNEHNLRFDKDSHRYCSNHIVSGPLYDEHLAALSELASQAGSRNIPIVAVIFNAFVKPDSNFQESKDYILLHKSLADRLSRMEFYLLDR